MWFEFKDNDFPLRVIIRLIPKNSFLVTHIYLCGFILHYLWAVALTLQLVLVMHVPMLYVQ